MRVVIQRVTQAKVEVEGKVVGEIGRGLLIYVGVGHEDTAKDAVFMADKLVGLRIFGDTEGKMNLSVADIGGGILLISNFTLYGNCKKGRRPGFDEAAEPGLAEKVFEELVREVQKRGIDTGKGIFGAHMAVESVNDGPVTFVLESYS